MTIAMDLERSSAGDPGDDTTRCRDLVVLIFRAVLRREPEEVDAAAFTNALLSGMTVYDFVSELMSTPEFRVDPAPGLDLPSASPPVPSMADATLAEIASLSLSLLQARLAEKGCLFQLGPVADLDVDQGVSAARMERVVRTLAILDVL